MKDEEVVYNSCSYCCEVWVEENQIVCDNCLPLLNLDLELNKIMTAINKLKKYPHPFEKRIKVINRIKQEFEGLINVKKIS